MKGHVVSQVQQRLSNVLSKSISCENGNSDKFLTIIAKYHRRELENIPNFNTQAIIIQAPFFRYGLHTANNRIDNISRRIAHKTDQNFLHITLQFNLEPNRGFHPLPPPPPRRCALVHSRGWFANLDFRYKFPTIPNQIKLRGQHSLFEFKLGTVSDSFLYLCCLSVYRFPTVKCFFLLFSP